MVRSSLARLKPMPQHSLVDGLYVTSLRFPQTAIIDGDAKSYSIAAASVIAKVTRDRIMIDFDREFPQYGFAEHKGYGTPQHLAMLLEHGPCPIHRRSFAPVRQPDLKLFASEWLIEPAGEPERRQTTFLRGFTHIPVTVRAA